MQRYVAEEIAVDHADGLMPRREALRRLGLLGLSLPAATALLAACAAENPPAGTTSGPAPSQPGSAPATGPAVTTEAITFAGPQGSLMGAWAAAAAPRGAVLVIHENRGLNPYIEDVVRRFAAADFLAFGPDALTPLGGYPGTEDEARALFQKLDQEKCRQDFVTAVGVLRSRPDSSGKVGVVGFCYGGGIAGMLATRVPELDASVCFYGGQPKAEDVPNIKAPLLIHYAENDERVNAGWPAYEAALKANGKSYEAHVYPGTQHGFNNDTTPRFDPEAAKLAWSRTIAFFKKHLG
jgi:carboxymethylenebutenolidase